MHVSGGKTCGDCCNPFFVFLKNDPENHSNIWRQFFFFFAIFRILPKNISKEVLCVFWSFGVMGLHILQKSFLTGNIESFAKAMFDGMLYFTKKISNRNLCVF